MSFEAITTISDAENRARQIKADAQVFCSVYYIFCREKQKRGRFAAHYPTIIHKFAEDACKINGYI